MPGSSHPDEEVDGLLASLPAGARPDEAECDDGLLLAYRRGHLDEAATASVESHLVRCRQCRRLLACLAEELDERHVRWAMEQVGPARGARWRWVGPVLAVAAALLVVVLVWPERPGDGLPEYTSTGPLGGVQATRATGEPSDVFAPHSTLRIDVRPAGPVAGEPPAVRVFTSRPGGPLKAAPRDVVVPGLGGAFRVEAPAARLCGAQPGPCRVHIAVGADVTPLAGRPAAEARAAFSGRWLTVRLQVRAHDEEAPAHE